MTACAVCGGAVEDAYVCTGCGRRLEIELGDVPALVTDLETVLARQTVYADTPQRVKGTPETVVPFDKRAGEAREHLHAILSTWVRLVHTERHANHRRPLPADRPAAMAGWLMHEVEWLRRHESAPQAIEEITYATKRVRGVLDAPPSVRLLGWCPYCEGQTGQVHVYTQRDEGSEGHASCDMNPDHVWKRDLWEQLKRLLVTA